MSITTWATVLADRQGVVHQTAYILYSVTGAGGFWNTGYGYTVGDALEQNGLIDHQPISYGPNGVPGAFPMQPSIDMGVAELTKQILLRQPWEPWALALYSEGAIVGSTVFDLVNTEGHPLNAYLASFVGAVTFGNPRRQAGHTIPGGIDPGGHGIVTPNQANVPDSWWDFAAGANMIGSPGQDLYTTVGYGGSSEREQTDQEAIWNIVRYGTLSSVGPLAKQILELLGSPFSGGLDAIKAGLQALDFFVVHGITPHTSYQFIQPRVGDDRDCWATAYDYLAGLALDRINVPEHLAAAAAVTPVTPTTAPPTKEEMINMTAPVAPVVAATTGIDLVSIEAEVKAAVSGLVKGLTFVQKFESLIPTEYRGTLDTAVKLLTVLEGVL